MTITHNKNVYSSTDQIQYSTRKSWLALMVGMIAIEQPLVTQVINDADFFDVHRDKQQRESPVSIMTEQR